MELQMQHTKDRETSEGLYGLQKYKISELAYGENKLESWFDRTEYNCGAVQLPQSVELFTLMKVKHF